jgi:hypothetical protein
MDLSLQRPLQKSVAEQGLLQSGGVATAMGGSTESLALFFLDMHGLYD